MLYKFVNFFHLFFVVSHRKEKWELFVSCAVEQLIVHTQLVSDPLVFMWEESEDAAVMRMLLGTSQKVYVRQTILQFLCRPSMK